MRIMAAGFYHDSDAQADSVTRYSSFVRGLPGLPLRRGDTCQALRGSETGLGGFLEAAACARVTVQTVVWAAASRAGPVTLDAFERIAGEIVATSRLQPVDAIYLDLHGAMCAEHLADAEGELLCRLRRAHGMTLPIVVSVSWHARSSARLLHHATLVLASRSHPCTDAALTGRRSFETLQRMLRDGMCWQRQTRRLPVQLPRLASCTELAPMRAIVDALRGSEACDGTELLSLSFAPAHGTTLWGYGRDARVLGAALNRMATQIRRALHQTNPIASCHGAALDALLARSLLRGGDAGPVLIAEAEDDPADGKPGDGTRLLRALLARGAGDAALGVLYDPHATMAAHATGVGRRLRLSLGGRASGDCPLDAVYEVEALADAGAPGSPTLPCASQLSPGAMARLRIGGVAVVVATHAVPIVDPAVFRAVGIEPDSLKVLALKSAETFRPRFASLASQTAIFAPNTALGARWASVSDRRPPRHAPATAEGGRR